jgi:hypothetical protein
MQVINRDVPVSTSVRRIQPLHFIKAIRYDRKAHLRISPSRMRDSSLEVLDRDRLLEVSALARGADRFG